MTLTRFAQKTLCSVLVLLQIVAFPAVSIAQEAAPEQTTTSSETTSSAPATGPTTPTGASNTGPTTPTGADASTYTQNEDGTWSNGTYTWDPNTKQTRPNQPQDYSYNPSTGRWDTTAYIYNPSSGSYEPNVVSAAAAPTSTASTAESGTEAAAAGANYSIDGTGPNSTNTINPSTTTNGTFDLFFNGAISNTLNSNATSGNALVQGNTLADDAISGDATAIANLLNMLQSEWLGSDEMASFIANIDGSLYGDLLIDPNQLAYGVGSNNSDIDINVSNNGVIDNDINLAAQSGNAAVDSNTTGGSALSGDARAIANVINMMNSAVNAGKSFLGMININGNLDGDILLPPGVLEALIANTGSNSTNTIGGTTNQTIDANFDINRTINNNIDTNAASGNTNVSGNTNAGAATSGQADTSINTMNIVGQNITGKNGLLVFVNVLGKWVGMVVGPAPTTATITNTGPASVNNIGPGNSNQSLTVNATENSLINNDINIDAQSGDATVSNNTNAGGATSGDAEASVNLLNMIGSTIDVSDWFGVLFINVFGEWFGSFGTDTSNGGFSQNPTEGGRGNGMDQTPVSAGSGANPSSNPVGQVFGFMSRSAGGMGASNGQFTVDQSALTEGEELAEARETAVFGNTTGANPRNNGQTGGPSSTNVSTEMNWWLVAGVIGLIATIALLIREYILALREERLIA